MNSPLPMLRRHVTSCVLHLDTTRDKVSLGYTQQDSRP